MPILARLIGILVVVPMLATLVGCGPSTSPGPTPTAATVANATAPPPSPTPSAPPNVTPSPLAPTATVAANASPTPVTVTDDAGRTVVISAPPQRIVSIAPSNTEILFALGLGDRVVGIDEFSNFPPEASEKPRVGSYFEPNLELIVAASPDLVLATELHVGRVVDELESHQIPTVVIAPGNLDETLDRILLIGQITGAENRAVQLTNELRERVEAVQARVAGEPKVRVFFELSPELHTVGPGSFVDDLITRAGGENVAADADTEWPQLSQEVLIQKDPEVILLSDAVAGVTADLVKARSGWESVSAVRLDRIVVIDPDLTTRPGPRIVDGLEAIARALHPDRFD